MSDVEIFFPQLFHQLLTILINQWWIVLFAFFIVVGRSSWFKGVFGEWCVHQFLTRYFKAPDEIVLRDVLLPSGSGTTQIDHVVLSKFGIFVIETKNMKGWIFGRVTDRQWTQVIYKQKYRFLNPLKQNQGHVNALSRLTTIPADHIHSIVVFVGEAKLKKGPENVTTLYGLRRYLKKQSTPVITDQALNAFRSSLLSARLENTRANKRAHIRHAKRMKKAR